MSREFPAAPPIWLSVGAIAAEIRQQSVKKRKWAFSGGVPVWPACEDALRKSVWGSKATSSRFRSMKWARNRMKTNGDKTTLQSQATETGGSVGRWFAGRSYHWTCSCRSGDYTSIRTGLDGADREVQPTGSAVIATEFATVRRLRPRYRARRTPALPLAGVSWRSCSR